tara:strand:- start:734 stop:2026 length:1293 start_codon:yes stop_codon:yes gene_type:complete
MKNNIILLLMIISSISYSQVNISTDYREDETWDGKEWIPYSSNDEKTFFEFEDTLQSKMGMFIHRTGDITSAYLIKSYSYNEEYDLEEFKIVSDVGNLYTLLVNIDWDKSEPSGYLTFLYLEGDGEDFRLVRHRINKIWKTESEKESTQKEDEYGCVSGDCDNGYGVYYYKGEWEGDIYRGNWRNGKRHGYGKYLFASGRELDGNWENGDFIDEDNNSSDWKGNGTGFFIDENGYLATNYHVVKDASYIEIEFYRDGELQKNKVEVVKEDKHNDLAILKISDENFNKFENIPYNFSTRVADVGEEVFALGYPMALTLMGKDIKFTDGKISSKTGYNGDIANYQTTTPIQGGNSGGPLFDYDGNLIAINSSILSHDIADNVSYSIKSSYLKNLVDVLPKKIKLPKNTDIKNLKLTEKIKVLSDYVVLIKIR